KAEYRKPKQIQNPKSQCSKRQSLHMRFVLQISNLFRISDFVFRISSRTEKKPLESRTTEFPMRACSLSAVCVCVAVLIGSSGCGGPAMATVRGKVTCKGKAVAQAHLIFAPVPRSPEDREPGKPATGFTDDNGEYILSTFREYDGALVGPH